jgi:type IV pilus assembly protein PilC
MEEKPKKESGVKLIKPRFIFGLAKDRDYLIENLSVLAASGMPIVKALEAIRSEVKSRVMVKIINYMISEIEAGSPLWKVLNQFHLFPDYSITLIRIGEESGRFSENLKVIASQIEKDRVFHSKIRSAMMYPVFVLALTVIIGLGIAWFILPRLTLVFTQMDITLPTITKVLIFSGQFLRVHGQVVMPPVIVVLLLLFYFLFFFKYTKFLGQWLMFHAPGTHTLIKEMEIGRFSYLLGTLLDAGIPITQALESVVSSTTVNLYSKFYQFILKGVEEGNSFQKVFLLYKKTNKLIPVPIQQLIVASEHSGNLSQMLLKIGQNYEARTDITTKNLAVVLEPILLVIVWLGVVALALAVILPIYSLIGNFKTNY